MKNHVKSNSLIPCNALVGKVLPILSNSAHFTAEYRFKA